jgi:hypothetical protein
MNYYLIQMGGTSWFGNTITKCGCGSLLLVH